MLLGVLRSEDGETVMPLAGRSVVGRGALATVRVPLKRVSSEHAVIWWEEDRWWVRDLGSRNGTTVDSRELTAGERVPLEAGCTIRFGGTDAWTLLDAGRPSAMARAGDGSIVRGDGAMLALPDAEQPEVTVYRGPEGGWVAEGSDGVSPVANGAVQVVGGVPFTLLLPDVDATWQADHSSLCVAEVQLEFRVSPDEEHVSIELVHAGGRVSLGSRAHHYLLVTLARQRLADVALSPDERGWMSAEELERGLRLTIAGLKVQVFRARQELEKLGVIDAAGIIERRYGTGQLRIGVPRVVVQTG